MQTKSEMINRIAELAKEVEQWKHEYEALDACCELAQGKIAELKAYKDVNEDFKTAWEELKAENARLKEEIETRDNLIEHFRKEAINWAKTSNDCIKDIENYKQTLQEIKAIAEAPKPFIDFSVTKTATEVEYDYAAICNELELRLHKVLELITKAEEE